MLRVEHQATAAQAFLQQLRVHQLHAQVVQVEQDKA
jgi:hypothetical protein